MLPSRNAGSCAKARGNPCSHREHVFIDCCRCIAAGVLQSLASVLCKWSGVPWCSARLCRHRTLSQCGASTALNSRAVPAPLVYRTAVRAWLCADNAVWGQHCMPVRCPHLTTLYMPYGDSTFFMSGAGTALLYSAVPAPHCFQVRCRYKPSLKDPVATTHLFQSPSFVGEG